MVNELRGKHVFKAISLTTLVYALFSYSDSLQAETPVGGQIAGRISWTREGSPYLTTANIEVPLGSTLTIEPGVEIRLSSHSIIVGGILGGLFTPTEAAIAAAAYALALGGLIHRSLSFSDIWKVTQETGKITASILFIVSAASIFAWIITSERVAYNFSNLLFGITDNYIIILLLINLLLLVVGCFLDAIAAISILTPILMPVAVAAGIDPVQFGVIMVLNLMIGLLSPPLGIVLYVLSAVSGVSMHDTIRGTIPFLIPLLITLMIVTFVPSVSLWLPGVLGL